MNNAFRDKSKDHKSKHYWFRYLLGQGLNNHNLISLSQYPREISQATMMTGSSRWQSAVIGGNGAWRARMRTMNPKSNRTCLYRRSDRGPVLPRRQPKSLGARRQYSQATGNNVLPVMTGSPAFLTRPPPGDSHSHIDIQNGQQNLATYQTNAHKNTPTQRNSESHNHALN